MARRIPARPLSITSNNAYTGDINVTISGGTLTSALGNALYEGIAENAGAPVAAATKLQSLEITGGTFVAEAADMPAIAVDNVADVEPAITGGTFSDTAEQMIAARLLPEGTRLYEVKVGNETFYSFADPNPKTGDLSLYIGLGALLVVCALLFVFKRERNAA